MGHITNGETGQKRGNKQRAPKRGPAITNTHAAAPLSDFHAEQRLSTPVAAAALARHQRAKRSARLLEVALGIAFPAAGLALWQLLAVIGLADRIFFPAPTKILSEVIDELRTADGITLLGTDVGVTVRDTLVGLAIGWVIGTAVGLGMGVWEPAQFSLAPLIYILYPMPQVVLYPLALAVFGVGTRSTVVLTVLGVFYVQAITTFSAARTIDPVYLEAADIFRLPKSVRYRRVLLGATWPSVITGLRINIGQALVMVLAVEFISSTNGLGAYIWGAWESFDVKKMYLGLITVGLLGALLIYLGNILERLAVVASKER